MKISEIRGLGKEEIKEKLKGAKKELRKERSVIASGTRPDNPCKIRSIRKNMARMLTVIREKELNEEKDIASMDQQIKMNKVKKDYDPVWMVKIKNSKAMQEILLDAVTVRINYLEELEKDISTSQYFLISAKTILPEDQFNSIYYNGNKARQA